MRVMHAQGVGGIAAWGVRYKKNRSNESGLLMLGMDYWGRDFRQRMNQDTRTYRNNTPANIKVL